MTQRPGLLRSASVYGTASVLQRALPVLLLPVLARYLTAADYGLLAVFTATVGLATPLVGLNVPYALRRRFFDAPEIDFGGYLRSALLLVAAGTLAGAVLGALVDPVVGRSTGLAPWFVPAAAVLAGAQVVIMIPLTLWQVEHRPRAYGLVQVSRSLLEVTFTLMLVVGLGLDWRGAVLSTVLTTALILVFVAWPSIRRRLGRAADLRHIRHAASYGGGLIPHALGVLAITGADRFFITHYAGAEETGLYWVGYQLGFVVLLVADAFNRAFSPWLYERLKAARPADLPRVLRVILGACAGLLGLAGVVSFIGPPLIDWVLPGAYSGAGRYVWWIACALALSGMSRIVSGFLFFEGRTGLISRITVTAAAVNLVLNAWWVPEQGAMGAARATAAAFAGSLVLMVLTTRRAGAIVRARGQG